MPVKGIQIMLLWLREWNGSEIVAFSWREWIEIEE